METGNRWTGDLALLATAPNHVVAEFRSEPAPSLPRRMAASIVKAALANCATRKPAQVRVSGADVLVSVDHSAFFRPASQLA